MLIYDVIACVGLFVNLIIIYIYIAYTCLKKLIFNELMMFIDEFSL